MNRQQLIETIADETEQTKADTNRFLDAFIDTVQRNMRKEEVKLVGFGTFKTARRKARTGRNPQTGEEIKIKARTVPVFRPGAQLREFVQKGK